MDKIDNFSDRLTHKMSLMGFTQESLAEIIGCSHSTVSRWMSGSKPRKMAAHQLASALRTTTSWLLNGGDEGKPCNLAAIESQERSERTLPSKVVDTLKEASAERGRRKREVAHEAGLENEVDAICEMLRTALSQFPSVNKRMRKQLTKNLTDNIAAFETWCDEIEAKNKLAGTYDK